MEEDIHVGIGYNSMLLVHQSQNFMQGAPHHSLAKSAEVLPGLIGDQNEVAPSRPGVFHFPGCGTYATLSSTLCDSQFKTFALQALLA